MVRSASFTAKWRAIQQSRDTRKNVGSPYRMWGHTTVGHAVEWWPHCIVWSLIVDHGHKYIVRGNHAECGPPLQGMGILAELWSTLMCGLHQKVRSPCRV